MKTKLSVLLDSYTRRKIFLLLGKQNYKQTNGLDYLKTTKCKLTYYLYLS